MARACVFCTAPADSREDVIPVWVIEHLLAGSGSIKGYAGEKKLAWVGPRLRIKAKVVCGSCNGGWMSDLESKTKPILGPLMRDLSFDITASQQRTIAKWVLKTAMVGESFSRSHRAFFYETEERRWLRDGDRFPLFTQVWIGRYVGRFDLGFFGVDSWDKEPANPNVIHAYASTILLGRLVMQVVTIHTPEERRNRPVNLQWGRTGPWDVSLIPLRFADDGTRITWPPQLTFGDAGDMALQRLIERAGGSIPVGPIPPRVNKTGL